MDLKDSECVVVLTTCPDKAAAQRIAESLVERAIAACVNIIPAVESYFTWEGKVERAQEVLLLTKTSRERYPEVEKHIRQTHPYEIPEIIALTVAAGASDYLDWIRDSTIR